MKLALLTGNHLCHNPRVVKEASALSQAGCEVEVLGAWGDVQLKERDLALLQNVPFKFTPVIDLTTSESLRLKSRIRSRVGRMLHQFARIENRWQLGYAAAALEHTARQRKADLFIAHSEPALWALSRLAPPSSALRSPLSSPRIGVDMEDWFSEDLLPEARKQRPVNLLKGLERGVLSGAAHSTCTSRAMSEALATAYGCRPPTVIYNAFPWADRQRLDGLIKDRKNLKMPSLHWYSQTLGAGRGLEELFAALPHVVKPLEIHLRGQPVSGFHEWLQARLPEVCRPRVFIHDLVSNDELLSRITEHDIGFAGEMKFCRNRDLTVTNKILHYLVGGLAVVASDTAGQREVAAQAKGAVRLYPSGNAVALASELNALLSSAVELNAAKAAALAAAQATFCWERQGPLLVRSVEAALSDQTSSETNV